MQMVTGVTRVQQVGNVDLGYSYTVVDSSGKVNPDAEEFLRKYSSGTARTYAYMLVKHLRCMEAWGKSVREVENSDLERYMYLLKRGDLPYSKGVPSTSTINVSATCLSEFYKYLIAVGRSSASLTNSSPTYQVKNMINRKILGHISRPTARLSALKGVRNYSVSPMGVSESEIDALLAVADHPRDKLLIVWLRDAGFRVGEICGIRYAEIHLQDDPPCGDCDAPHVHICHKEVTPNMARVKVKHAWAIKDGIVEGGQIRRASPSMIHTYFDLQTSDWANTSGFLLRRLDHKNLGSPLGTHGARNILKRLCRKADIREINPHEFRHRFAHRVLEASQDTHVASVAGGWQSAQMVEQVYGHPDLGNSVFEVALAEVWNTNA